MLFIGNGVGEGFWSSPLLSRLIDLRNEQRRASQRRSAVCRQHWVTKTVIGYPCFSHLLSLALPIASVRSEPYKPPVRWLGASIHISQQDQTKQMVYFKLSGFLVKPWIRWSLLKVTAVTSQVTREVTVTVRCRMGPASSREDEEDPAATDNGLAIAIPDKTSENQDDQQQQQQQPEETVSAFLLSDWCNRVIASWFSIWHLSVKQHRVLL